MHKREKAGYCNDRRIHACADFLYSISYEVSCAKETDCKKLDRHLFRKLPFLSMHDGGDGLNISRSSGCFVQLRIQNQNADYPSCKTKECKSLIKMMSFMKLEPNGNLEPQLCIPYTNCFFGVKWLPK